jgi:hypothetical protein
MPRLPDATAYAVNWWLILLVDAAVGVVAVVVGAVLIAFGHPLAVIVALIGIGYLVLVGRRALRWRRLRIASGL